MDPEYGSRYSELYRSHWWWRAREVLITRTIRRIVPATGWQRILDVGCGDGLFLPQLSQFAETVEGLEVEESLVSRDSMRRYTIHVGELDERFRPSAPYDLISMMDVLEHIPDSRTALDSCREMLTPNGVLLLTVPALQCLWTSHDDVNQHQLRYTLGGLRSLVEEAGFAVAESRYFFHWLVGPKWVVGKAERVMGNRLHQAETPPRILNGFLYGFSRFEQVALSPFRWLPGSSALLVARRA